MPGIIPVFVPHMGCPHACVFCDQRAITAAGGVEDVGEVIAHALFRSSLPAEIAFYGGSFTAIPETDRFRFLKTAKRFLDIGLASCVRVSTRPDCVTEEILEELRAYCVTTVEIGAQSMIREVLDASKRGHTPEDTVRAARLIKAAGLGLVLQMMIGLPGDSAERTLETARRLRDLGPDAVRIYPVVVIEGTELCGMYRAGTYEPLTVDGAAELTARVLDIFDERKIRAIRVGLNPNGELSGGAAVAGAYHPAFGELARSNQMLSRVRALLGGKKDPADGLSVLVAPHMVSRMTGNKRQNIERLKSEFGFKEVRVVPDGGLSGEEISVDFFLLPRGNDNGKICVKAKMPMEGA